MRLFERKIEQDGDGYACSNIQADTITKETITQTKVKGEGVLLVQARGDVVAYSNICPHAAADLGKGVFRRGQIKCPDHGYAFDVRSGRAVWPEDEVCRMKRFDVKIVEGIVWIKV